MEQLFGLYFLGLLAWQAIETNRLVKFLPDWTGDGLTTVSDWWLAWIFAWETPTRALLDWFGPDTMQFFELDKAGSQPLLVVLSIVVWTAITFVPMFLLSVAIAVVGGPSAK